MDRKCFIALPFEAVDPQFFLSCLKLVQYASLGGVNGTVSPQIGDSAIGRARNMLTRKFLESDCSHLLFIDSDLVFSADQINRIMSHDDEVVGGLYCKKGEGNAQLVINTYPEFRSPRADGLQEVRYIGTGFLRVARSVFERMIAAWEEQIAYTSDFDHKTIEHDFWHMGVYQYPDGTRRYLTEDWWFCQKCLDLGIKVWADTHVVLRHSGNVLFPLKTQEPELFGHEVELGSSAGAVPQTPPAAPALPPEFVQAKV